MASRNRTAFDPAVDNIPGSGESVATTPRRRSTRSRSRRRQSARGGVQQRAAQTVQNIASGFTTRDQRMYELGRKHAVELLTGGAIRR